MKRNAGFTLIELLVVIAIIAILAAILFPVFAKARAQARKISCISNEKQLGMGLIMYFQDYDEQPPLVRDCGPGNAYIFTPKELVWKDLVAPYIKDGGRQYNSGQTYTSAGPGGVYQCPDSTDPWASTQAWGLGPGQPGDETTRYPRSYAVNSDCGVNEMGPNYSFWPTSYSTGGSLSVLQTPANDIMVGETRIVFPDIRAIYTSYEVNAQGQPWGGMPESIIKGHGGGFTNFIFFDGHAKTTKAIAALQNDMWDCYAATGYGPATQNSVIVNANTVPEWNPGL